MPAPFDRMARTAFAITTSVMGYDASWGGYTAKVHLKNPTKSAERAGVEYDRDAWEVNYHEADFPGLMALVERRTVRQVMTIEGVAWWVAQVSRMYDGFDCRAQLVRVPDEPEPDEPDEPDEPEPDPDDPEPDENDPE
jgi:hypothetical protein